MRLTLLICTLSVIFGVCGCRRVAPTTSHSPDSGEKAESGAPGYPSQARALLEKGKELYRTDHDAEAVEAFERAIKIDPDLAEAHFRLGLSYEAENKAAEAAVEYKKAVEAFTKYVSQNPEDAEAHYQFGQTYAALHEYSEAVQEYRRATKLRSDDGDIYYDLGMALTKLARYDEAVTAYSKALEIDPEDYRAQDALDEARQGVARIKAGKKHLEELLKKQKEDELKKAGGSPGSSPGEPIPGGKDKNQ
jgi:tetratricopeptide (TPR) repeat protein